MSQTPTVAPIGYVRALLRRPASSLSGAQLPRLERSLPAAVADERRLDAFRRLTGYPDNGYLPLTWPHIAAFPGHFANLLDRRFPLPLVGTIHIRSNIHQHRPIGAGEALRCVCILGNGRDTSKGVEFDLETKAYVGADLVWEGAATMLRRSGRSEGLPEKPRRAALDGVGATNRVLQVPERTARAFARVSGDLNPIHLSKLAARAFGFRGVVIHGMWSLTRMAALNPNFVTQPNVEMGCDFKLPLILPAQVIYRHWSRPDGGLDMRLLDRAGNAPHAVGTLTWRKDAERPANSL